MEEDRFLSGWAMDEYASLDTISLIWRMAGALTGAINTFDVQNCFI